jgi:hypothetical protein
MNGTLGAGRLAFLERAPVEPLPCVGQQLIALGAEVLPGSMVPPAIDGYHRLHGPAFPIHPQVFIRHG